MRTLTALPLLAAALGCASSSGQRYHDANMDFGSVRTVVVMPFGNMSRDQLAGERVREVLSTMLLSTGAMYVVPSGEVARTLGKIGILTPATPTADDVVKIGTALKADAVVTGVVKEYGEVRSGSAAANVVSISVQMMETSTGKIVWAAATTKGGITATDRLFGGGGGPINDVTEAAVDDVLSKLFK